MRLVELVREIRKELAEHVADDSLPKAEERGRITMIFSTRRELRRRV